MGGKMFLKSKKMTTLMGIIGTLFVLWASGFLGLCINGISHVAGDVEGCYNVAHPVEGEYTVEIDLDNLETNEGKLLFDDGDNQIYVSKVLVDNSTDYQIYFRSSGKYSLNHATLVSGIEHAYTDLGHTITIQAKAQGTYRGITFELPPSGSSGLNYRDGDEFGFYLFPGDESVEVDLKEETVMEVKLSNLYVNIWMAKKLFR